MDEDSDDDDDSDAILGKMEDIDEKEDKTKLVGPDDATFSGELADGVNRIRVRIGFSKTAPLQSWLTSRIAEETTLRRAGERKHIQQEISKHRSIRREHTVGFDFGRRPTYTGRFCSIIA